MASGQVMAETRLILAFSGWHRFDHTRWTEHYLRYWVLDMIVQGRQSQRIGELPTFERTSGLLALYAPQTLFYERQVAGQVMKEAYMVFEARGTIDAMILAITGPHGYCHLDDSPRSYRLVWPQIVCTIRFFSRERRNSAWSRPSPAGWEAVAIIRRNGGGPPSPDGGC